MKDLCSFSLLAKRKRTKRKGLFGPHKSHFCLRQNQFRLAENPSKASGFYAASETYDYICGPAPVKLRRTVNID
ncbi:MAG: hypothetical protein CFE24_07490 [Flavobacterium sp. BFFFF2]|nr:MAG: hypothetical protein CFE24_07490 [Flavobacterium sp. BFFFF2]